MSNKANKSSVRHTRATQRDQIQPQTAGQSAKNIEERLHELIHPTVYSQIGLFRLRGLRARVFTLSRMIAFMQTRFSQSLVLGGSILAGLLRKTGLLSQASWVLVAIVNRKRHSHSSLELLRLTMPILA